MNLFLSAADADAELRAELTETYPGAKVSEAAPLMFALEPERRSPNRHAGLADCQRADSEIGVPTFAMPHLTFARQWLPSARAVRAESIRGWAALIADAVIGVLPDNQPWALHVEPHYGARARHHIGARAWHSSTREKSRGPSPDSSESPTTSADAGRHRCRLIREALAELLQKRRRHLLRQLRREPATFGRDDSLVQLLLTAPDAGFISVATSPLPLEQRHLLAPFPKGEIPSASDKNAPSRAFAKLVEAEARLGRLIQPGETCVDLGAAPGSWTYSAVGRGARVIAVDRSPLRDDLMRSPQVSFQQGDAFAFAPKQPVDWLICDVIAPPEQSAQLLLRWLRQGWCRRFVVTIKLKDSSGLGALAGLKRELPPLTGELFLTRLCANKKEACAFGAAS